MFSNNRWGIILLALVVALAIGVGAYNYGFSQGVVSSPQVATAIRDGGHVAYPYAWHYGPFGFGFFPLFPFFAILVWILIARAIFWGRPWRGHRGWYGPGDVPPMFDEWHRRAHEQQGKSAASS
jgi:hypothetical protein